MEQNDNNEALEAYLDELCRLYFIMPEAEQVKARQELRQHLLAMVAMQEADGLSEPDAVTAALNAFGDPRTIGRETMKEWLKKRDPWDEVDQSPEGRRYAKIVRVLIPVCIGLGFSLASVEISSPKRDLSWAWGFLILVVCGTSTGLLGYAWRTSRYYRTPSGMDAAKRYMAQGVPALPPATTIRQRLNRWVGGRIYSWAADSLKNDLRDPDEKPPAFDFGKLIVRMVLIAACVILSVKWFWPARIVMLYTVFFTVHWLTQEVAGRIAWHRRHLRFR